MAESFYPFDNATIGTELQWSRMFRLLMPDGVDALPSGGSLKVTKGTGLNHNVAAGSAWLRGFYYNNTATLTVALPTNPSSNPRIDVIVLRASLAANNIIATYVQGTPAVTPTAPALTKNDTTGIYEMPLAHVRVEPNDATTVTDRRRFIGRPTVFCASDNRPDPEGRPLLAFETDTDRVIYHGGGSGGWVLGMGNDAYRPLFAASYDNGTVSTTTWDTTLTGSGTPSLSLAFNAPLSGKALIRTGAFLSNTAGHSTYMAVRLTAADGTTVWATRNNGTNSAFGADRMIFMDGSGTTASGSVCSSTFHAAGLTPGTRYTALLVYAVSGGIATIDDRFLEIDPLP